jgi:hypothetical protein
LAGRPSRSLPASALRLVVGGRATALFVGD